MKRIILPALLIIGFACITNTSIAQPFFQRYDSIDVTISGTSLVNPWAGGLNFVQTSSIDLNMDGIDDLFTFDRTGDKIRTFINHGTANTVDYKFDASYESKFPVMHNWAILADYNNDGKKDIFTYSNIGGGMDVYKNVSTIAGGLQFQLVSLQQKSIYNPTKSNYIPSSIPDGGVTNTWDGSSGTFVNKAITVTNLNLSYWKLMSVSLDITHANDADVIVYLVAPGGSKIRLIRNAGGSGHNFTSTSFEMNATNVIGSTGFNSAPFKGGYAPEAGPAAWNSFIAGIANPNGVWSLNVGDQTSGNSGIIKDWSLTFYSPTYSPPSTASMINLYISSVDIPALSDLDNDGDLDLVTFAITGTFMEYHQNLSMELYGIPDSLCFYMKNRSWGYAAEDPSNNNYYLNDSVTGQYNVGNPGIITNPGDSIGGVRSAERHSGSCQLCIDLDNDGDKEFIVGDVSFANLTMLTNGGTPKEANMVAVDTHFPENTSGTIPVDLTLFPCAYYEDVNNDNVKDLIVSPNATNASENFNSEVYYKNTGTNTAPVFEFQQANLLQDNMIEVGEGAYPVFFDYNNDGLKDLFIGNYGYYNVAGFQHEIALFKNVGTPTVPKYDLVTRDYNNLSSLNIVNMIPTFGDMDGDGDADMMIGSSDGRIDYFQNIAPLGATANFVLSVADYKNTNNHFIDVGDFAAPQIVDVDNDGMNDLVIGGANGKFTYYHHTGSPTSVNPALDSATNFWGHIKVNQAGYFYGYSYPFIFKEGGVTQLLAGSQLGYLRMYSHIDGNLTGTFTMIDSTFMGVREGERTAPCGADITGDGLMDLVVGNYQGGVAFFRGRTSLTSVNEVNAPESHWNMDAYPNPADNAITIRIVNDNTATYEVELYNTVGQLITSEKTASNMFELNTAAIPPGIYFCKVTELSKDGALKGAALVRRIVVQH
ncbi:MAG: repeat protein [Bacteroidetes bacterium]|nr:repeat protein [Bacteroidota bacterium]